MTVGELLEALEGIHPSAQVRLMTQPAWPFESRVAGVWNPGPRYAECQAERGDTLCGLPILIDSDGTVTHLHGLDDHPPLAEGPTFTPAADGQDVDVVYLLEGDQLGYGTSDAWNR